MLFISIYNTLCEKNKQRSILYCKGSNLHEHHIKPRHVGGTDDKENLTYLTIREHIIAHYLLWKIHKNPNDLRSMKMLGANLTSAQRKIIGEFCRDNGIGFHNDKYKEDAKQWRQNGIESQKNDYLENGNKQSFYYWSTEEGRKERASLGGKVGQKYNMKITLVYLRMMIH